MSKVKADTSKVRARAAGRVTRAKAGADQAGELELGVVAAADVAAFDYLTGREAELSGRVRELRDSRPAHDEELVAARREHSDVSLALNLLRKLREAGVTKDECRALAAVATSLPRVETVEVLSEE